MGTQTDTYLKTKFQLGDIPTEQDFIDLIDSKPNRAGDYFGTPTDNTTFEADGTIVANGGAVVWNDAFVDALSLRNGASAPTFESFSGGVYGYSFAANGISELHGTLELPHDYKEGTDIDLHIHWSPSTTNIGGCTWVAEFTISNINSAFPANNFVSLSTTSSGVAKQHQVFSIYTIPGTGRKISDVICFRIARDGSDGNDTFTGKAFLHRIALHYQCDTLGSRQEYIK